MNEKQENELMEHWRQAGIERGYDIASCQDLPEIGDKVDTFLAWAGLGETIEDYESARECFFCMCSEAEDNNRSFSPFEFTAHEINSYYEKSEWLPEMIWDSYDNGIQEGFENNWNERKHYYEEV